MPLSSKLPVMNVYASLTSHGEAFIVANHEGLIALRKVIEALLQQPPGDGRQGACQVCEQFCTDGEGYPLIVVKADEATLDPVALPYVESHGRDPSATVSPWSLPSVRAGYDHHRAAMQRAKP